MRIFCIGKNYADHVAEMKSETPDEPVIFTKPDTALVRGNAPFIYPKHLSSDIHHEVEMVLRIGKNGKGIDRALAMDYLDAVGVGIDFTLRDRQSKAKAKGLPWDTAKGFDQSAPVSELIPLADFGPVDQVGIRLDLNGQTVQTGNTRQMINSVPDMLAYISLFYTLRQGDLLFTGTPSGVGPVQVGDQLQAFLNDQELLSFEVR